VVPGKFTVAKASGAATCGTAKGRALIQTSRSPTFTSRTQYRLPKGGEWGRADYYSGPTGGMVRSTASSTSLTLAVHPRAI